MSSSRFRGCVPVLSSCLRLCTVVASAFWAFVVVLGLSGPAQAQDGLPTQAVGMLQVDDVSASVMQAAEASVRGVDRRGKDGPLAAVGMELALLYHQNRVAGAKGVRALREASAPSPKADADDGWRSAHGQVFSPISADGRFVVVEAIAAGEPSRLLQALRELGLEGGATAGNVVSGRLPVSEIKQAAALPALRAMMPSYARTTVGSVGSEADTAHAADAARVNTGTDGSGQKVCVLSDSYNQDDAAATSASGDVQSGDLPGSGNPEGRTTPVDVLDDSDTEGTDEGRAMLQLIHDIAPGAALGFHTATAAGLAAFASGIQDLANASCTVIVDDIRFSTEPFYQDGPVANAVNDVVNNNGVAYFSSAGNSGQNSYEAPFRNSGEPGVISSSSVAHDFNEEGGALPPTDTRQEITIEAGGTFQIFSFQWTDPSAQVQGSAGPDTDLDIALVDADDNIVAQSADDNISNGVPSEFLEYTNDGSSAQTLFLVIEKAGGPDPEEIKYVYSSSGPFTDSDATLEEHDTLGPTIFGHPMAEGAMAVAAAPFYNTSAYNSNADPAALEPFSSKGGIQIRFDQNGDKLGAPEDRGKPDVTGTDAIDNTFFGSDIRDDFFNGIDADSHPNFFGTSAAAPSVAAIAALIRQARPGLAPTKVYSRLEETAADVTTRLNRNGTFVSIASGRDPWSGHGFVRAKKAVPPISVAIANADAESQQVDGSGGAVTLTWRQIGGGDDVTVSEFVIKQRYFGGRFTERARVSSNGPGKYSRTIKGLPVGRHQFRIEGVATTSAGKDTLLVNTARTTLRASRVNLTVYPNPFSETTNLSVTLPEAQEDTVTVRVFDILGRQVAVPVVSRPISNSESIPLTSREIGALGSGVYFFHVTGSTFRQTARAVRVR